MKVTVFCCFLFHSYECMVIHSFFKVAALLCVVLAWRLETVNSEVRSSRVERSYSQPPRNSYQLGPRTYQPSYFRQHYRRVHPYYGTPVRHQPVPKYVPRPIPKPMSSYKNEVNDGSNDDYPPGNTLTVSITRPDEGLPSAKPTSFTLINQIAPAEIPPPKVSGRLPDSASIKPYDYGSKSNYRYRG